jgi:hypothetical protein
MPRSCERGRKNTDKEATETTKTEREILHMKFMRAKLAIASITVSSDTANDCRAVRGNARAAALRTRGYSVDVPGLTG